MTALMNVLIDAGKETRGFALTRRAVQAANRGEYGQVYTFTNNAGTHRLNKVRVVAERPEDNAGVVQFCQDNNIGFVMVGPEQPLVDGVVDALRKAGILVFGPSGAAAELEGDKYKGRLFCKRHNVPHPGFEKHTDRQLAIEVIKNRANWPIVVKYNGLMGGKGVEICHTQEEAAAWVEHLFAQDESAEIVFEEYLLDDEELLRSELSLHVVISLDGSYRILPTVMDYKPRFEGDKGPMTGSMGCYAPVPWANMAVIEKTIVEPIIAGLKKDGLQYGGVLYVSLKKGPNGYFVVEFNVRFGDPEMTVLDRLIEKGLMSLMMAAAKGGDVSSLPLEIRDGAAIGVVLVDPNYTVGKASPAAVFPTHWDTSDLYHAATYLKDGILMAKGGRNAVMTDVGDDVAEASKNVMRKLLPFDFRRDIGAGF